MLNLHARSSDFQVRRRLAKAQSKRCIYHVAADSKTALGSGVARVFAIIVATWSILGCQIIPANLGGSRLEVQAVREAQKVFTLIDVTAMTPAGTTFKDCSDCPEMIVVPAGRFIMGSPETEPGRAKGESPRRDVIIARPFAVGMYEVTRAQMRQFVKEGKHDKNNSSDKGRCWWVKSSDNQSEQDPAVCVSWLDAQAYVKWLSMKTGQPYRLLSEAEWEYAARAGSTTRYWWGNDLMQDGKVWANCRGCGYERHSKPPVPVGTFAPNSFGLYDTSGNAWEWVEDCYHSSYTGAPKDGSVWTSSGGGNCKSRVVRGGCYYEGPNEVRSASRYSFPVDLRHDFFGLRVARTLR